MSPGAAMATLVLRHHSKSFALAQRLLPAAQRIDAAVVYAWCRRADDAVDEQTPDEARRAVVRMSSELDEIYAGSPQVEPLLHAFQEVVRRRKIPKTYPEELLRGMEMDVTSFTYASLPDLYLYCYRVAGTVGLMMCFVMGVTAANALKHAAEFGMAMQFTNICRDVVEDWKRGRLYLPLALLPEYGAPKTPSGAFPKSLERASARVVEQLLNEADRLYTSGAFGLRYLSRRCAWAVLTASLVYSAIGSILRRRNYAVVGQRARVGTLKKLGLVLKAAFQVVRSRTVPTSPMVAPNSPLPLLRFEDVVSR